MKRWWPKVLLLLLLYQVQVGAVLLGQAANQPFVRKFEAGYPNYSYFTSIWPSQDGWWGLFTKFDSLGPGEYYYGAEVAVIDSQFNVSTRVSHGDTNRYYFEYPAFNRKTIPDGKGNFWYWMTGYIRSNLTRPLYYGKMDASGHVLFESAIPKTHEADYFYEFLPLPGGGGVFVNTHRGRFAFLTWLNWVDSLGNITHLDSTERINNNYLHGTAFCTYDSIREIIVAPSQDFYFTGFQSFNMRPRISFYSPTGTLLGRKDLTAQLQDNVVGSLHRTDDGGYFGFLMKYILDTTAVYEDHQPGVVKLDSNFDVVWKKYLFPPKLENEAYVFHQSKQGDFFYAGRHDSYPTDSLQHRKWFITKFSRGLDSLWTRIYDLGGDSIHGILQDPTQIQVRDNGDILVLVDNSGYWPPSAMFINYTTLYKLDSLGCLIGNCVIRDTVPDTLWPAPGAGGMLVYPNPSAGEFLMAWDVAAGDVSTLRVWDMTGRALLKQALLREEQPTALDLRGYAPGVYLLEIVSEKGRKFRAKVLVLR